MENPENNTMFGNGIFSFGDNASDSQSQNGDFKEMAKDFERPGFHYNWLLNYLSLGKEDGYLAQ